MSDRDTLGISNAADIGVVVIEDDRATQARLGRSVTAAGFTLLASEGEYPSAAQALREHKPNVTLLDLDLLGVDATPLIGVAKSENSEAKVVVISALGDESHALRALRAGADGFLLKSECDQDVGAIVDGVLAGEPPLSPAIARHALRALNGGRDHPSGVALSPRELQMLKAIAMGYSHREIAARYELSYHTVVDYVRSLYRKLEVSNRSEALMAAVGQGIIGPES